MSLLRVPAPSGERVGAPDGGSKSEPLPPEALRPVRFHDAAPEPIEEGRPQLDDFIDMAQDVVLHHDGPAECAAGKLPRDLRARFFAGGWLALPGQPVDHLLDADSSMVAWDLQDGRARVRARPLAEPACAFRAGHDVGRTSVHDCVAFEGSVIAASAQGYVQIDPDTLAPRDLDAFTDLFDDDDPSVAPNLHPQIDPRTGRLLTCFSRVTPALSTELTLFEIGPGEGPRRARRHFTAGLHAAHAFAFTESSYVVPFNPLSAPLGASPSRGLLVHVLPRDLALPGRTVCFRLHGFVHHVINAHDEGEQLVFDAFVSNLDPEREASHLDLGRGRTVWTHLGGVLRFSIDRRRGEATSRLLLPGVQRVTFECIDERVRGLSYRRAWLVSNDQHESHRSEVVAADVKTGEVQRWSTRDRLFFRQPRYVPAPGAPPEGAGWLLVPAYSPSGTSLMVFDAHRVARGPIAVLTSGVRLPYTNHGCVA